LETVQLVEKLQPEVLVVDLMIPRLNGLEVTRQIKQRMPQTRVVVLSMHANEPYVLEALKNGASGYVLKGHQRHGPGVGRKAGAQRPALPQPSPIGAGGGSVLTALPGHVL
jgi:chemotaxis response regulator CheB